MRGFGGFCRQRCDEVLGLVAGGWWEAHLGKRHDLGTTQQSLPPATSHQPVVRYIANCPPSMIAFTLAMN
jgi:hypothetical protein